MNSSPRDPLQDAVADWEAQVPDPEFVDRTMARLPAPRRRWPALTLAAAAVLLGVFALTTRQRITRTQDAQTQRTTLTLGSAGRAVFASVSDVSVESGWWSVGTVTHREGAAFYRLNDTVLIKIPGWGQIESTNSSFTLEVTPMRSALKGAVIGAATTAALVITVYEGRVAVAGPNGPREVAAGQRYATPPEPEVIVETEPNRDALQAPPVSTVVADADVTLDTLRTKLAAREREVADLKAELGEIQADREAAEGLPIDPPPHLDAIYEKEALMETFNTALKEAGFDGEVSNLDCSEYPCLIIGRVKDDDGVELSDRLRASEAMAPYADSSKHMSVWGGTERTEDGEVTEAWFAAAVHPEEDDADRKAALGKRLRIRTGTAIEALRKAERGE